MNPKVSIIIPCFNSEKFIAETIESALKQTWDNKEIIVVDDGSTDRSHSIAKEYESKSLCVYRQDNQGACRARNFGFEKSSGELIQYLDADDLLSYDKIEMQVKALLSSDWSSRHVIHSRWGRFRTDVSKVETWGPHESIRQDVTPAEWLIANSMSMTACWLVHRDTVERAGPWNIDLKRSQDGEFFSRVLLNVKKVLYCDHGNVFYRSGIVGSISQNFSRPSVESTLKALELMEEHILALENSRRAKQVIANNYQDFAHSHYIDFPDLALQAESRASHLGGACIKLQGGHALQALSTIVGWKSALAIKKKIIEMSRNLNRF